MNFDEFTRKPPLDPYVRSVLREASEAFGGDQTDEEYAAQLAAYAARKAKYERAIALLNKWANENSDFDARVEPLIDAVLRESSPRHFSQEPAP